MATRAKKPTPKTKTSLSKLAAALDFVAVASKDTGKIHEQHCVLFGQMVYASNGILSAAHPIEEDLQSAPHLKTLRKALMRAASKESTGMSIVAEADALTMTAGKFRVRIPSLPFADIPPIVGDLSPHYPVTPEGSERLRAAVTAVADAVADNAEFVVESGILMTDQMVMATNRAYGVQAFHGLQFPKVLVPKMFVKELLKNKSQITGFGVNWNEHTQSFSSLTISFEGGAWLKTQLLGFETYPAMESFAFTDEMYAGALPLVENFFTAFEAVAPFALEKPTEHRIVFTDKGMQCGAAFYEIPGLVPVTLNPLYIGFSRNYMDRVNWSVGGRVAIFYGNNVRGAIALCRNCGAAPHEKIQGPEYGPANYEQFQEPTEAQRDEFNIPD